MADPDEEKGGTRAPSKGYQPIDKAVVNVELDGLIGYYMTMTRLAAAAAPAMSHLSDMTLKIQDGLALVPDGDVQPFPEGQHAAQLLTHRQSDFRYFMKDLLEGIGNIGAAAAVVAEIYENADSENAATVTDIGFVLTDPTARGPAGFRPVKSLDEQRREAEERRGQMSMAATGQDQLATVARPGMGGNAYYTYPDGSQKAVLITTEPGDSTWTSEARVITTIIYAPDGTVISTKTERSYTVRGSSQVRTVTVTNPGEQPGSSTSSTTSTVTEQGGRQTVSSETTTTQPGKQPVTNRTDPVTIDPNDQRDDDSPDAGPVEKAERDMDTEGSKDIVGQFGRGY